MENFVYNCITYRATGENTVQVGDGRNRAVDKDMVSVVIPDMVTHEGKEYIVERIGNWAFLGSRALTSVSFPNSVTSIGNWAFCGYSSLTSLTLPASLIYIGESAFDGCRGLASVILQDSLMGIGNDAFSCCTALTSITLPVSLTSIGERAFFICSNLTSVTLPESLVYINQRAFVDCLNLKEIICIATKEPFVGKDAFYNVHPDCTVYLPKEGYNSEYWTRNGVGRVIYV